MPLEPCPYCLKIPGSFQTRPGETVPHVACSFCGAQGPTMPTALGLYVNGNIENAAREWNIWAKHRMEIR